MVLAVTWVISQEYEAAVYFPSRRVSDFIVWNLACQCCIYTEPKERFLLMHMEYCVMLNLRRSVKTKNNSLQIQNSIQKKTQTKRNQAKEKMQRKPDRMANRFLSRSLFWDKAWAHMSRNDAGKVTGSLQTILCLLNLDSSYSIGKEESTSQHTFY